MGTTLTKLRVVLAFAHYRVGDVIERQPALARDMLAARWYGRKMVEEYREGPSTSEIPKSIPPPPPQATEDERPTEFQQPAEEVSRSYRRKRSNP